MRFDLASGSVRIWGAREVDRSLGTIPISDATYRPDARVPCEPWSPVQREPTTTAGTAAGDAWEHHRAVAVVSLPSEIIAVVRRLGIHDLPPGMARLQLSSGIASGMLEQALRQADQFLCPGYTATSLGWRVQTSLTPTLTIDKRSGLKTGLHVDSWDGAMLDDRGQARNRLCMNLGTAPRYFLFIGLTLRAIWEIMARPSIAVGGGLGQLFLERFPDYPVTRLLVEPGFAYIAPTENLLHDGAAAGPDVMDISYTLLGRFQPSALRAD